MQLFRVVFISGLHIVLSVYFIIWKEMSLQLFVSLVIKEFVSLAIKEAKEKRT